jgi:hypothetical protein
MRKTSSPGPVIALPITLTIIDSRWVALYVYDIPMLQARMFSVGYTLLK